MKKVMVLVLMLGLLLTQAHCFGNTAELHGVQYTYVSSITTLFEVNDFGKATFDLTVSALGVEQISAEVILQQYKGGYWQSVKTWNSSIRSSLFSGYYSYYLTKGYSYRVKYIIVVSENGSIVETITKYTESKGF